MRFPVDNYERDWYSAQGFGKKVTNTYWHEGEDLNLKTGGDTDLGQPIFAIAEGIVTSVHNHVGGNSFGKHIHIKHVGLWGSCWSHCSHCLEILVKEGDKVTEGQRIALLGKSGTDVAHLHFAIKREATGIDAIATTEEELKKWHNPLEFIRKWQGNPENDDINIVRAKRDENWSLYTECKKSLEAVQEKYRSAEAMAQSYENFFNDVCEIIKPDKRDIPSVIGRVTALKDKESSFIQLEENGKKLSERVLAVTTANIELERRLGVLQSSVGHEEGGVSVWTELRNWWYRQNWWRR